ncbi:glycosyltransferase family 25 protein [Mesorhizobium sp.]|uniref:glycosyltransferase family 25 protein n=1 Tax=Mesorhizobium sp. TaxID=1871066 RepID=UPI000FE6AF20|nr:glycosyltransferase family 25 protein [Mesorhizobium sp.]RWA72279.1 MAG: glycosyltransferase family 25 protein [Mesorhizobium sp.]RWA80215.1 MAG: glycosyltransferase family 25 protein [Mesorhizobium sp.]
MGSSSLRAIDFPNLGVFVLTVEPPGGARRTHAANELGRVGISFDFVQSIDQNSADIDRAYSRLLNWTLHKRSLTRGEISVYLGHRKIWREAMRRGLDFALIFEDDFKICNDEQFIQAINDAISHRGTWSIVKFFDFNHKKVVESVKIGATQLVGYKYPASGAVAYLINRQAAQSLLHRRHLFRPIDEDFSHPWEFSMRVWSTSPNLVDEVSFQLGGSILERERCDLRRKKVVIRSIWGNFLQARKLVRSLWYRRASAANVREIVNAGSRERHGQTYKDA